MKRLLALSLALATTFVAAQDFPNLTPLPPPPAPASTPAPTPAATPRAATPARRSAERTTRDASANWPAAGPEDWRMGPPEAAEFVGPPVPADTPGAAATPDTGGPIELLGQKIEAGTRAELRWQVGQSFDGTSVTTPVIVVRGLQPGPRLCLTASIHGDELNGIEVVRRVANDVDPKTLTGTLVGVPIVNLLGFSRGSRYLPDRRDLNRYFPGTAYGSSAARIAHALFRQVIVGCDALVDFHTGSFDRANLPQVRGDLTIPSVLEFTRGFGAAPVLHSPGTRGMLRLAATDHGIPSVTFEVGAPTRLEPEAIDFAVQSIATLMHRMGMTRSFRMWAEPQATFYESKWVRVDSGGMLFSSVRLGDRVREGQRLGKVIDPVQNEEHAVTSPLRGRVIGMALNQLVLPGFAAYHIGIEASEAEVVEDAAQPADPDALEQLEGDQMPREDMGPPEEAAPEGEGGGGA